MNLHRPTKHALRHPTRRFIALWSRWIHIYLSLLCLAVIFLFSITGLTLNHPDWFFSESTTEQSGSLDVSLLNIHASPPANWDQFDYGHQVDKLAIAELLRSKHGLRGTVTDFFTYEEEAELTYQGPGYTAIARLSRSSGDYTVAVTTNDLVSVFNDLHKGRNSGKAWSIVIDVSAIVSAIVALSGFALIFFLRVRRTKGILTAITGAAILLILYRIAVS
ncbi:hypothetical protein Q31b_13320 [Novipirellula aureliae]|uniref:PepSY-associated TM helix n=1 Tax=Novipirellula aureliae TaxID=2527966 RepID=A0A5C6E4N3_9BACT|nr:PepSY-associated TM helix domain-containing protein [Novipirellula aureliae]TWU43800.1 hypothetical protein Q31b_13320 [Novipirellula aureliae]